MKNEIESNDQVSHERMNTTINKGFLVKKDYFPKWRILANEEKMETYRLLEPGEFKDVVLCHDYDGKTLSNLPKRFGNSNKFTWGYCGTGPSDLTMSLLLHFSNDDLEFTHNHAREFLEDFTQHFPMDENIVVSGSMILEWISVQRNSQPKYTVSYKPVPCGSDYVYNDFFQIIKRPKLSDKLEATTNKGGKYVR